MNKVIKLTCPNCGAEYLPEEIFVTTKIFNKLKFIKKTSIGKITDHIGGDIDLDETYKCDYCNRKFSIDGQISFSTSCKNINNHVSKIKKPNLFMKEN